jgi:hypothetical protein
MTKPSGKIEFSSFIFIQPNAVFTHEPLFFVACCGSQNCGTVASGSPLPKRDDHMSPGPKNKT